MLPAQADVYSFGVMLWEIVTGLVPTRGGLTDVTVPDECPSEIAELIQACITPCGPRLQRFLLLSVGFSRRVVSAPRRCQLRRVSLCVAFLVSLVAAMGLQWRCACC